MLLSCILGLLGIATALPFEDLSPVKRESKVGRTLRSRSTASGSVLELKRQAGSRNSAQLLFNEAPLISLEEGQEFSTAIAFGSQSFQVIIDTGSSDTWLAATGFTCVNQTNNDTLTPADCLFGSSFNVDSSFTAIPGENFNVSYADGEYLNGPIGYDSVTLANITVPKQEVGLASLAAWDGDGVTSGLVGLAFPSITSAFSGTNATADNFTVNQLPYPSIIDNIFEIDNLTAPEFSIALSRDMSNKSYGGVIAISGVPSLTDPTINASSTFVSTPFEILTNQFINPGKPQYQFYTINMTDILFGPDYIYDASLVSPFPQQAIVDSGTTLNYVPTDTAIAFNSLWDPPAYGYEETGLFFVNCTATPAPFAVVIDETVFQHNLLDLVLNEGDDICISGIQDAGGNVDALNILGDVFLKNVLAVFDWGTYEMEFSSREYYES